jgi:hypothetical protein
MVNFNDRTFKCIEDKGVLKSKVFVGGKHYFTMNYCLALTILGIWQWIFSIVKNNWGNNVKSGLFILEKNDKIGIRRKKKEKSWLKDRM